MRIDPQKWTSDKMKKEQTKHFVPDKRNDTPACNAFQEPDWPNLAALSDEIAKGRRDTNCGNCRRTRVFRKLK